MKRIFRAFAVALSLILIMNFVRFPGVEGKAYAGTSAVLQRGSKGEDVKRFQTWLIALGYLTGDADGSFGPMTEEAVKAFQTDYSLQVTGVVEGKEYEAVKVLMLTLAQRAAIVAMTNAQATDVFSQDGNTYDPQKFHSYSDETGFYLNMVKRGEWKTYNIDTWEIDDMKLEIVETGTYMKVSMDMRFFGTDFVITNVKKVIAAKIEDLDSRDASKTSGVTVEPDDAQYLTVPISLVIDDRESEKKVSASVEAPQSPSATKKPAATKAPSAASKSSVYYSTNDNKTVKNGNSGVYAYKSIYDVYYIIDFDKGYVYYFANGNGNSTCDRVKIESGDLNNVLIITYHDGGETWSYGLHFSWKNQPDHLIVQDEDGFEWDYYPTDLNAALALKAKKTIYDY